MACLPDPSDPLKGPDPEPQPAEEPIRRNAADAFRPGILTGVPVVPQDKILILRESDLVFCDAAYGDRAELQLLRFLQDLPVDQDVPVPDLDALSRKSYDAFDVRVPIFRGGKEDDVVASRLLQMITSMAGRMLWPDAVCGAPKQ